MKRRKTQDAIEDSATRMVLERGFDEVTVEEICADVGVSKRTFFNYVDSKEAAVLGSGPRVPEPEIVEEFLRTRYQDLTSGALDFVITCFVHRSKTSGTLTRELVRRRKKIRAANDSLAFQHFAQLHQARDQIEEVLAAYLEAWPQNRQLSTGPREEAITLTGLLFTAVSLGSRKWHEGTSASTDDFRDLCHEAMREILRLQPCTAHQNNNTYQQEEG